MREDLSSNNDDFSLVHLRTRVESFDHKIRQLHGNRLDRVRGRSGRIFSSSKSTITES